MNIVQAIADPQLFAPWFNNHTTWRAWTVVLRALFALPLETKERRLFHSLAGGRKPPSAPVRESWWVIGRRGGKSFVVALVAVYLACFREYTQHLAPGERGTVMILAADRKQARVIFRYIQALLTEVPMLARLVERQTAESIDLGNRISIEVHTASFRSVRGYTIVAALLDEIAFWRSDESANPDAEILAALRPAMATIPNSLLIGISSPYRRAGVLYEAHRDHFGQDCDHTLVIQADTRRMNPTVPEQFIKDAYERDPLSAAAEYGAEFRSDVASFLNEDWITAATPEDVHERPYHTNYQYVAFVDPSGGGKDSFTLAIAHWEDGRALLDVCRGRTPPFDPSAVVAGYADLLRAYRISDVTGDRYAGQWVVEAFGKEGVGYKHSRRSKSEIYLECEPKFATGAVELLDHRRLLTELRQLERRTARGGKDRVDHPPRGHDDHANAAAGALLLAAEAGVGGTEPCIIGRLQSTGDFYLADGDDYF